MASGKTTQNHDEIRKWAEARGGKPGAVRSTERPDDPGILRICFPHAPHHNNEAIEEIGWDEFFEKFDEQGLQMIYQEKTADGKRSDFNKLTYPDVDSPQGKRLLAKSAGKKGAQKLATRVASVKSPATTAAKKSGGGAKPAAKKAATKKAAAKKTPAKKTASKAAGKKAEPPVRNFPKPEHGHGHGQVF